MAGADVLIIGAGAAGLMAARELARAGKKVCILEARQRTGGRIHTLHQAGFSVPVEAGAEFIHGDLPLTQELLKEAGIRFEAMEGKTWQVKNGELQPGESFIEDWPILQAKLQALEQDMTIARFLDQYFGEEEHASLRNSVLKFVEGYDAADTNRASAFALRQEWSGEDEASQYRMPGGYGQLIDFLSRECLRLGCTLYLSTEVGEIRWKPGQVEAVTTQGAVYKARRALLTTPLGVWASSADNLGHLRFTPPLPEKESALSAMGFGNVVKILLEFKQAFWEKDAFPTADYRRMPALGFLFSDAPVPTWWTRLPEKAPLLTGWLGGPEADRFQGLSQAQQLDLALTSLSSLFRVKQTFLRDQLVASQIIDWGTDPYARGAYTYATVETPWARQILAAPVEDTLYFAGEALYEGPEIGTVEAALASGKHAAEMEGLSD
jgi:monoamine oxidase